MVCRVIQERKPVSCFPSDGRNACSDIVNKYPGNYSTYLLPIIIYQER